MIIASNEDRFWAKHVDNDPNCKCRICYWGKRDSVAEIPAFLKPLMKPLEVRVAEDIDILMREFASDFGLMEGEKEPHKKGKEWPEKEYSDLTSYADAIDYAKKNCPHNNIDVDNPFSPSYVHCDDCEKHMSFSEFEESQNRRYRRRSN